MQAHIPKPHTTHTYMFSVLKYIRQMERGGKEEANFTCEI